jgi:phage I-like protein
LLLYTIHFKKGTPTIMTFSIPKRLQPAVKTAQAAVAKAGKQAEKFQQGATKAIKAGKAVQAVQETSEQRQIEIGTHFMPVLIEKTHPLMATAQEWTGSIVSKATKSWKA